MNKTFQYFLILLPLSFCFLAQSDPISTGNLAQQIFDAMVQVHEMQSGFRPIYAKGIVCSGSFTPSKQAATLSKAAHFQSESVPITVRFSNGASDPLINDASPDAGPRGLAIRFHIPDGTDTDILTNSHNGFVVGTGEEFLVLAKTLAATDRTKPHPWPIDQFLSKHPHAMKFVEDNKIVPTSFATESFFSNDSFVFVNKDDVRQAGRYKIVPLAGRKVLSGEEAKSKPSNFLVDELRARIAQAPIEFHLVIQLPNAGDPTNNPSIVWPDNRRAIDVGLISITMIAADTDTAEKSLAFDPINLTDGIELSDDPMPDLRSMVYQLSVLYRNRKE